MESIQLNVARSAAESNSVKIFSDFAKKFAPTSVSDRALVAYLTMNPNAPAPATQILAQAAEIYEASVSINPFLNTIVVPSTIMPGAEPLPKIFTAADLKNITAEGTKVHDYVALGGTFDRLHAGHKMLLTQAALCTATRLRVGVTGEKLLVNKKNKEMLQPFEVRRAACEAFLRHLRSDLTLEVVELTEKSGGTNAIAEVNAMVVSPETLPSLESINAERREKGFKDMEAIMIAFVGGNDNSSRLSSSKLREMEMAKK